MKMGKLKRAISEVKYKPLPIDEDPFEPDENQLPERRLRNAAIKKAVEFRHLHKVFFTRSKYNLWLLFLLV